ncbi:MAG: pyridoxamine 5'-phosphate oxidase family protein [Pseudomonadota bacterium]
MLTADMKTLINNHRAGMVATVNDEGAPSVSPKATFVILDDAAIAFGNIRSPGTLANIRKRPAIEVCFIDVVLRKAVRVTGSASIIRKADADDHMQATFDQQWADYLQYMSAFVKIDIKACEMILSPAYDLGMTEDDLRRTNLEKLNGL